MAGGYTGKILHINLTTGEIKTIPTSRYEEYGGGIGIGTAIFWDMVADKLPISAFDPENVVTIMTSPLSGTLAPAVPGRTEVNGIGAQSYPLEWFTRSNFGGRFSPELKFAGWDGIVIEGRASSPVWLKIINDDVSLEDASWLWGMDTWTTQQEIWREFNTRDYKEWYQTGGGRDVGRTTQRPAVLTIGPLGEVQSRWGCLIHDAGNAAGQGGFGGVFGSKNLKAIAVLGTGSVEVANPAALFEARMWARRNYSMDHQERTYEQGPVTFAGRTGTGPGPCNFGLYFGFPAGRMGPQACVGCHVGCRRRDELKYASESQCIDFAYYAGPVAQKYGGMTIEVSKAAEVAQRWGANAYELSGGFAYMMALIGMDLIGPGKAINTNLPLDRLGEAEFVNILLDAVYKGEDIGLDLREGFVRAAEKWGRLEEDLHTGILDFSYWGYPEHAYDPRAELEWGYGSILGDRDINEHCLNWIVYWYPLMYFATGQFPVSAQELSEIFAEKAVPFEGDPLMLDYGTANMYSEHMAKLVAWHRYYTRFWKQSIGYCDWAWPDIANVYAPDNKGMMGEGEPRFLNAVTGKNLSFADGVEIGQKIWNIHNAIWTLQGRHRDMVYFSDYIHTQPYPALYPLPVYEDGQWAYKDCGNRYIDRAGFDEFKTRFYSLMGWDTSSGWPTRTTLESLGLGNVADLLEAKGKLGA